MGKKNRKIRVKFRKNRQPRSRRTDWTRKFQQEDVEEAAPPARESMQVKGDLSRRRTIVVQTGQEEEAAARAQRVEAGWQTGRVLLVSGHVAIVEGPDAKPYPCAISRVLRTLEIEERSAVVPGDQVYFRLAEGAVSGSDIGEPQGMIESVCPRRTELMRAYRGREHVMAANVDQVLIISALAQPRLKPNLIDRYIAAAERGGIRPVLCLNKADLVDLAAFQPFIGLYSQLGYEVVVTSARTKFGLRKLQAILAGRSTVLAGQSGVGKSSLLNAIQPELNLRVAEVSRATQHGRHITSMARLLRLKFGGWVSDTPGIRQFELWDVIPEEVEGFFVEFRPYVPYCRFPNCTHTHERDCAVKEAVDIGRIDAGRYRRYLNMFHGEKAEVAVC